MNGWMNGWMDGVAGVVQDDLMLSLVWSETDYHFFLRSLLTSSSSAH